MSTSELFERGLDHHRAARLDEAEALYSQVLAIDPRHADALHHLAVIACQTGRADAVELMRRSVALKPDCVPYLNNLGVVLQMHGMLAEADACFTRALTLDPNCADAHLNVGLLQLLRRDFARGWKEYEWRSKTAAFLSTNPRFDRPRWEGDPLSGRRLLLHSEQGIGDVIQFARYVPMVAKRERGSKLMVLCPPTIRPLLERSLSRYGTVTSSLNSSAYDVRYSIISLASLFQTTAETIPAGVPYLKAGQQKVKRWRERLAKHGAKFRVGIAWAGNKNHERDRQRSIPLSALSPITAVEEIAFYSLQKGESAEQLTAAQAPLLTDYTQELHDFDDTAALVANLDLVISVDTAVAHLAGAMGKPVWVMLPFGPDWRWQLERTDSPWYPTMRLFRQPDPGKWHPVVEEIAAGLRKLFAAQRHRQQGRAGYP